MTSEFDSFSSQLLEEAKRFLEKAQEASSPGPFLHGSILLAFSALESHINAIADEMAIRPTLDLLTVAILRERDVKLAAGRWELSSETKFYRLEDRLAFLFREFGEADVRSFGWWPVLNDAIRKRNALVHPRDRVELEMTEVRRLVEGILNALNDLYRSIYSRPLPSKRRGLQSSLNF